MPPVPDAFLRIASVSYVEFGTKGGSDIEILRDVSFSLERGETLALLGVESTGRGAVMRMIAGLKKPTSGFVSLQRKQIEKPGLERSFVFKETQLFPWLTLAGNIEQVLRAKDPKGDPREIRERGEACLEQAKLSNVAKKLPAELSAEEACWGSLVRSLAVDPAVLLLEDCFGNLTPLEKSRVLCKLQAALADSPVAVVLSTDDPEDAALLAERIALLSPAPAPRVRQMIDNTGVRTKIASRPQEGSSPSTERQLREGLEALSKRSLSQRMSQMHHV